jgi:flavin reductase (DIM6/NTAB) family NADH-FMN oxidoreductase RutF
VQVKNEYTRVIPRKYPEQVVIAIVKDSGGKYNPITLGWTMITSHKPPMMAIAVAHNRHSRKAIEDSEEFVIAFPSSLMADAALFYGTKSGRDIDKLKEHPVATEPATEVDSLLLTDALANFECKLESQLETGDHMLYVGRIVASHANTDTSLKRVYTLAPGYKMGAVSPDSD